MTPEAQPKHKLDTFMFCFTMLTFVTLLVIFKFRIKKGFKFKMRARGRAGMAATSEEMLVNNLGNIPVNSCHLLASRHDFQFPCVSCHDS